MKNDVKYRRQAAKNDGYDDYCEAHNRAYNNSCPECDLFANENAKNKISTEAIIISIKNMMKYTEQQADTCGCCVFSDYPLGYEDSNLTCSYNPSIPFVVRESARCKCFKNKD